MKSMIDTIERRPWLGWLLFLATVAAVFVVGLMAASIVERRQETYRVDLVQPLPDWEPRNAAWGVNFPLQYESYLRTSETDFKSVHGGSAEIDYLAKYPQRVVLWAGYPFARDYKQGRGHYHAVDDVRDSLRTTTSNMPGTCWACKSTDVPRVMAEMGIAEFYASSIDELGHQITNHIGCQDCHDPQGMSLRITRPALAEALERQGKNIQHATHQDMRSLACAQCHVEYYFKGEGRYLTFPWDKGTGAEEMEAYYDEIGFSDWTHALSRAPMLKAQHPDYELYLTGVHAQRGVSCADCHMPYKSQGGQKFTDHHLRSPLADVSNSCAVCHREDPATLARDVVQRQNQVKQLMLLAEDALTKAHIEAKAAWDAGATAPAMQDALRLIRHAQWRWDFVAAANGAGFHSPVESSRLLGTSIHKAETARMEIARVLFSLGVQEPVAMPDLSSKARAQAFVGLDMAAIQAIKDGQRATLFPAWDAAAAEREAQLPALLKADAPKYRKPD
jgi:nitrite reductase (cytochrome c-552)